jgi:regulator of sigma E protease
MLNNVVSIAMVVVGIGFVIFIHELGHFLLAKLNGVKVEKFALGFDFFGLRLYSRKLGETEYVIGAIPLGGYVKMLGEDPSEAESGEAVKDPRAYHNKPVGARMAIISAGVVMNLLFGWACFTYFYLKGKPEIPPIIGSVIAGMPAYEAGLLPGDTILAVDDRPIGTYSELKYATIFSGDGQVLRLDVQRPGATGPVRIEIRPQRREDGLAPSMGIFPADDVTLLREVPFVPPAGSDVDPKTVSEALRRGRTIVAAGPEGGRPEPVRSTFDLDRILAAYPDRPLTLALGKEPPEGARGEPAPTGTLTLPPVHVVNLGLRMTPGPIAAVRAGSPASAAGLRAGDRIVAVDGRDDYDPLRLPDLAFAAARAGREIALEVDRANAHGQTERLATITLKPEPQPPWLEDVLPDEPLDVPGLGLALAIEPAVAAVRPGSPAAEAGIAPGAVVRAVMLTTPAPPGERDAKPGTRRLVLDGKKTAKDDIPANWVSVFDQMQRLPRAPVELLLAGSDTPIRVTPEPVADWYFPRRGLQQRTLLRPLPPQSFPVAVQRGLQETGENVLAVYYIVRGLIQQRLSKDAVGGPIKIFDMGYQTAQLGLDAFLPFLAMLSVNLAVVNFFPIPPLDGGQLLFLMLEKIRGRPVPERYAAPVIIAGIALIILLFLVVNLNDVLSYFRA